MKLGIIPLAIALLFNLPLMAQNDSLPHHTLLLIPYQPKMSMLEIGKAVHDKTGLGFDAITEKFRRLMDAALYKSFNNTYKTTSLLTGRQKSDSMISYIYSSTSYKYDLIDKKGKDTAGGEFNPNLQKAHFIHNGQLDVPIDDRQRFMNVAITNPKLLQHLFNRYNTDIFLFINEMDIVNTKNPAEEIEDYTYRRQVWVHYSILDKTGKYITGGIATSYFPFNQNDPEVIGKQYLAVPANTIFNDFNTCMLMQHGKKHGRKKALNEGNH